MKNTCKFSFAIVWRVDNKTKTERMICIYITIQNMHAWLISKDILDQMEKWVVICTYIILYTGI